MSKEKELLKIVVEKNKLGGTSTNVWLNGTKMFVTGIKLEQELGEKMKLELSADIHEGMFEDDKQ